MTVPANDKNFPSGKLPVHLLDRLLKEYAWTDDSVVVGPGIGVDAAVIKTDSHMLVLKSDPITFTADDIGPWSVVINANDIAVMGATPRWFLATLLLPAGEAGMAGEAAVEKVMRGLGEQCKIMGVSLCGGHTEITDAVTRPVLCGHMVGEVGPRGIVTGRGACAGNLMVLTKGIAIEGTAVLAIEARDRLADLDENLCKRAVSFTTDPGISIVEEAVIAASVEGVTAMHDPTEGGLSTAIHEMTSASGTGVELFLEKIRVYPETDRICRELGLDPMGLLASGALLVAVKKGSAPSLCDQLKKRGIEAEVIGRFTDKAGSLVVTDGEGTRPLAQFDRDEVARALSA